MEPLLGTVIWGRDTDCATMNGSSTVLERVKNNNGYTAIHNGLVYRPPKCATKNGSTTVLQRVKTRTVTLPSTKALSVSAGEESQTLIIMRKIYSRPARG